MYKEINALIYKFENLGIANSSDGAMMIGKAPHLGSQAWINIIYPKLRDEEIIYLENELKASVPDEYRRFLMDFSNGANILSSTLSLDGLRRKLTRDPKENSRQPFSIISPNLYDLTEYRKENYFFIGGYQWDGSHLYIDKETGIVHCCERYDATSKIQWAFFEEMLLSELKRLYQFLMKMELRSMKISRHFHIKNKYL